MTERREPPYDGSELEQLVGFLDYQRATLRMKTDGLDADQLNRTLAPSPMTLGGMVKHLALCEDSWFCTRFAGADAAEPWASVDWDADDDWDWHSAVDDSPDYLRALWEENVERARDAVRDASPGDLSRSPSPRGNTFTLRWIVAHMIEEYARHNGHADLIRESIDGSTGE